MRRIAHEVEGPMVCGLARALAKDIERAGEALKDAPNPRIHTFIGTSEIHMQGQMRKGQEDVLKMAVRAVELAKSFCDSVEFSPMDAARTDPSFLHDVIEATIAAGATTINIPDTVGYAILNNLARSLRTFWMECPTARTPLSACTVMMTWEWRWSIHCRR